MTTTTQAKQGQIIARIAVAQPERPTSADVLGSLNEAFKAGYEQATEDLATGILGGPLPHWRKRQAL
jgi:hypothetical protein